MKRFFEKWTELGTKKWVPYVLLFLIGIFICVLDYQNEMWDGGADNYWHYYFSKYAFQFPKYFLHHWGKPIFILITCTVCQFGFYALNVFNIFCGLLSGLIVYKWCKKMEFGFSLTGIVIVLFAPGYFSVIQSGLTEPLFGLLVLYSAYLLYFEKYTWAALVISTLPFSRSEGMFILMIFAVYLMIVRQFKKLPLLTVTFIIYAFLGLFAGKGFLWYITENPYAPVSPYGHGSYWHFVERYDYTFGGPYLIVFAIGLLAVIRNIFSKREFAFWKNVGPNFKLFCLSLIPTISFFLFHLYAWGSGKFGSAGLERVMSSVIPLGAVICMVGINTIYKINISIIRSLALIVFLYFAVNETFFRFKYPTHAWGPEKVEREAADWFVKVREKNSRIFYAYPALIFYANYNPFDKDNAECFGFPNSNCIPYEGKELIENKKFYYIWDSYFCENSCGNKLSDIENCPNLKRMREFNDGNFKLVFFESIK
jgi:hypothetical protein